MPAPKTPEQRGGYRAWLNGTLRIPSAQQLHSEKGRSKAILARGADPQSWRLRCYGDGGYGSTSSTTMYGGGPVCAAYNSPPTTHRTDR